MLGLIGGDNVWGVIGYIVVGVVMGVVFEVCLGREWNKFEEVKLKYLKIYNFV